MLKTHRFTLLAVAAAFAGALGANTVPAHAQTVKIDGSSTVFPITEAMAEDFQKAKKGKIRVTVGISGTGGGLRNFCRGETDISTRPDRFSRRKWMIASGGHQVHRVADRLRCTDGGDSPQ